MQVVISTENNINVTTTDVLGNYTRLYNQVRDPVVVADVRSVREAQKRAQEELLATTITCPISRIESIRDRLPGLRSEELKELLQGQLYNPEVQQAASCIASSIFYSSPYDRGSLHQNERIRSFFRGLHRIGAESVEGYALVSSLDETPDFFVIKTARDPRNDGLGHELLVGLFGTNLLRAYLPNFAYVYGGFKCSPPILDDKGEVVSWCTSSNRSVNYVVYEDAAPSVSLDEYCKTCTGKDWLSQYMQILYAERKAYKICEYTHYDLHTNNILVRVPPNGPGTLVAIPYETERGTEYLLTPGIATVIDYGFNHISTTVRGRLEHFGRSDLIPFSVFPDRGWPIHDAYKVLMFSMAQAIQSGNKSLLEVGRVIFRFFNKTESLEYAVTQQRQLVYCFPYNNGTKDITLDMLIRYIRVNCDTSFLLSDPGSWSTLACANNCVLEPQVYDLVGLNDQGTITDLLDFYDTYSHLYREGKKTEARALALRFRYNEAMIEHKRKYVNVMRDLLKLRTNIRLIDLSRLTVPQIMNPITVETVKNLETTMASIIDLTYTARALRMVGEGTARLYSNDTDAAFFRETRPNAYDGTYAQAVREGLQTVRANDAFLDQLLSGQNGATLRSQYLKTPASWYWEGRVILKQAFPIRL